MPGIPTYFVLLHRYIPLSILATILSLCYRCAASRVTGTESYTCSISWICICTCTCSVTFVLLCSKDYLLLDVLLNIHIYLFVFCYFYLFVSFYLFICFFLFCFIVGFVRPFTGLRFQWWFGRFVVCYMSVHMCNLLFPFDVLPRTLFYPIGSFGIDSSA